MKSFYYLLAGIFTLILASGCENDTGTQAANQDLPPSINNEAVTRLSPQEQAQEKSQRIAFDVFDVDRNGQISSKEALVSDDLVSAFINLDVNGNGELSAEEFSNYSVSP